MKATLRRQLLPFGLMLCLENLASQGQNLLINGDFEAGNTGFTSDYTFARLDSNVGTFDVVKRPTDTHFGGASFGDHTTGSGLMFMANGGSTTNAVVWKQTVSVATNMLYRFAGWSTLVGTSNGHPVNVNFSKLAATINGEPVLTGFEVPDPSGAWKHFSVFWTSHDPAQTQAEIEIRDMSAEASGNDFALDDLVFESISPENCLSPAPGLVGWWPGDGYTNNLAGEDGAILVNSTFGQGLVGEAFAFSGGKSYVRIPNNPTLSAITSTLTLEAWVLLNHADLNAIPQRFITISPDNVILRYANGQFTFSLALAPNNAEAFHVVAATNAVGSHQWYHLAATYDGTVQSLYVNGVLSSTSSVGPPLVPIGQGATPRNFHLLFECRRT